MKVSGERKWGNGWQRVIGEMVLHGGRIFDLYQTEIDQRYIIGGEQ